MTHPSGYSSTAIAHDRHLFCCYKATWRRIRCHLGFASTSVWCTVHRLHLQQWQCQGEVQLCSIPHRPAYLANLDSPNQSGKFQANEAQSALFQALRGRLLRAKPNSDGYSGLSRPGESIATARSYTHVVAEGYYHAAWTSHYEESQLLVRRLRQRLLAPLPLELALTLPDLTGRLIESDVELRYVQNIMSTTSTPMSMSMPMTMSMIITIMHWIWLWIYDVMITTSPLCLCFGISVGMDFVWG